LKRLGDALSPPEPTLRASVVVPARDEEDLISSCLQSLAAQQDVSPDEYEVLLVLDACSDATEERALAVRRVIPSLRLYLLDGPGRGSGHARRVGMDAASQRLHALERPDALICCTDADTVVAPDWLSAQLDAAARGARAIGGRISLLDDGTVSRSLVSWHEERGRRKHQQFLARGDDPTTTQHWQFSGASISLTADTYRRVGGIKPLRALEDEHLERVLLDHDVRIHRLSSVRVVTSPRTQGRALRGLAHDLALASRSLDDVSANGHG
jgi:glycosyltransferase involved in cell wall biosynthesis